VLFESAPMELAALMILPKTRMLENGTINPT
jgi:hypothetical protein